MGLAHFNTVALCIINGSNTSGNHYDWSLMTISEPSRVSSFMLLVLLQTYQDKSNATESQLHGKHIQNGRFHGTTNKGQAAIT